MEREWSRRKESEDLRERGRRNSKQKSLFCELGLLLLEVAPVPARWGKVPRDGEKSGGGGREKWKRIGVGGGKGKT